MRFEPHHKKSKSVKETPKRHRHLNKFHPKYHNKLFRRRLFQFKDTGRQLRDKHIRMYNEYNIHEFPVFNYSA